MRRRGLGISGTVSALLTVLLLVAGFAVSTGLLSAIYSSQAEVLRKAVNIGEAVSERLQAFVYEDVRTNRTMLTVRNVGSTGSEVEYLMAVGYDGNVLKEVRLAETVRLGTQQAYTTYLSKLLGSEFDNYTDVRSRMAVLYLKTVKGGVFGSAYMAPPSVMTAAYVTSTTTISTTETTIQEFYVQTGATAITTWEATVIIDNPMHWPVETYVGVAFPRHFEQASWDIAGLGLGWHYMSGFPAWGLQPGFKAKDRQDQLREVGAGDIYLPRGVVCTFQYRGWLFNWVPGTYPVYRYSRLGPTYFMVDEQPLNIWTGQGGCVESFEPRMAMPRIMVATQTYIFYAQPPPNAQWCWTEWNGRLNCYICHGWSGCDTWGAYPYTTINQIATTDLKDRQYATFPAKISSYVKWSPSYNVWAYVAHNYKLAYIKAVSLFNTTEVLAYVRGNETSTIHIKADRPIGLAAVYAYDSTDVYIPPPPDTGGGGDCWEIENVYLCKTGPDVVANKITGTHREVQCGQGGKPMEVTIDCGKDCKVWVAPKGAGNYKTSELQPCPNGRCTVPPGSTIIYGYPTSG
jgi:hypothetical protein